MHLHGFSLSLDCRPQLGLCLYKQSLAKPVKKKEPFTVEMLKAIAADAAGGNSLADACLTTACLLAFTGFLRYDKVYNICPRLDGKGTIDYPVESLPLPCNAPTLQ